MGDLKMKKKYIQPSFDVMELEEKDIVTTSVSTKENFDSDFTENGDVTKIWKW